MIKKLRAKFVCIFMVTVAVLLLAIFGLICNSTQKEMRAASLAALQSVAFETDRPHDLPGGNLNEKGHMGANPCFVLWQDPSGQLEAWGSDIYDLSNQETLLQILAAAEADGNQTGILFQWNLRYYRMDKGPGSGYAFLDISNEVQTMSALILSCAMFGLAALAVFFVVAVLLARWLVKPVEEAFNAQRQFVADASHELKTPLTVILTNAELLQSEEYDVQTKQRFANSIFSMSIQMRGLVESLLQLARVDNSTSPKQMQTVFFSQLAEECILPFEPVYFEAGRSLESQITPDIRVQGMEQQLRQVVDILLDNGRKYSTPGSTVVLKLTMQGYNHCQLSVASQGAPLTPQQCKEIFKRFYRVDEARSMNHSYGLGLPIAEGIISRHRGKIWCQSKDGVNTFYVSLPASSHKN